MCRTDEGMNADDHPSIRSVTREVTMTPVVPPRPARSAERAIVERALEVAALEGAADVSWAPGTGPIVIAECECGCGSVAFGTGCREAERRVADAVACLPGGEQVDVIVRARGSDISSLEIIDYGQGRGRLPLAGSVRSWDPGPP